MSLDLHARHERLNTVGCNGRSSRRRLASAKTALAIATGNAAILLGAQGALAANQSWVGTTDANWTTVTNWSGGAVPGINPTGNSTNTTDVATFNAALSVVGGTTIGDINNPILIDGTASSSGSRMIGRLTFDTANAGAYYIGAASGSPNLQLGNNLGINMTATVVNPEVVQAPISLHLPSSTNGVGSITNDSTTSSATLTIASITNSLNSTRGTAWTLGGANTGNNVVHSISISNTGGVSSSVTKTGAGRWILDGANTIPGGVTVSQGTLAVTNAGALGSANANVGSVNGGILEIDGVALSNTSVTLTSGGTLLANGAAESAKLVPVAAAATNVTLSTTNAGDVFTIGNGTNSITGGTAGTSVLHTSGPGTIVLSNAGTYAGSWSIDAGTVNLGSATALGPAATATVAFGAGSTGKLQLNSNIVTLAQLNTNATPGSAIVENGGGSAAVLTVNNTAANTFAGVLGDGTGGGSLGLTKTGAGNFTLTGANTYSGNTTIGGGTLLANNGAGSATGSSNVAVNSGGTLGGTGLISGAVTLASGGHLSPGSGGVGTLSVGSLTLNGGSQLDYDITNTSTLDKTLVTTNGGLTINGGQLNINGGVAAFTTNGVYNLIGFSGAIGGSGAGSLTVNPNNESLATNTYTIGSAGGFVTLAVASSGGSIIYWNADADGNWSTGPWTGSTPNSPGAFASFGGGGVPITANRTISVDGSNTVGTLAFNNPSFSYTLAAGSGANITLDNSAAGAFVTDSAGNHTIQSPLTLTSNGATFTVSNPGDTLTVSGAIGGSGDVLTKAGTGTLVLSGTNAYSGGTNLNAGTIVINSATSLGDPAGNASFGGGTLKLAADVVTARNYVVTGSADAIIDTNGHTLTQGGTVSAGSGATGGLTKNGAGTLLLQGTNSYVGNTTINAGTVSVASNANLGDPATGAAINLGGGTLATTATLALDNGAGANARAINTGAVGGTIDVADQTTLTVAGAITGAGVVTKTDTGTLVVSNTANTAPFIVSAGTLTAAGTTANTNGGFGSGAITLQGGATLSALMPTGNTLGFGNALTVPAGQTGTIDMTNRFSMSGAVSGAGTLNLVASSTISRDDFSNNWAGFIGNLNISGSGNVRFVMNGGGFNAAGLASTTLDLEGTAFTSPVTNSTGNTVTIGALSGISTTAGLGGGSAGAPNYTVGGLNTSTTFAGLITGNSILTKVGTGTLTLTNANSYSGLTNINGGTLNINGQFALGGAVYAGTAFNGGTLQYAASLPGTNGTGDITQDSNAAAKPVTLGANGGTVDTNGNDITYANPVGAGAGAFTKAGAGTLTLAAATSYTGNTNITGGTLALSGSGAITNGTINLNGGSFDVTGVSASPYVIGAAQTLKGQGLVNGNVTVNGTVSIGQTINTAGKVAKTLTIGSGSTLTGSLLEDLTAVNASDKLVFGDGTTSTANLGGVLTLTNPNAVSFAAGQNYDLLDFGSETGTFSTVTLPTLSGALSWDTSHLYSTGVVSIITSGPANLTWNNSGGTGNGTLWDTAGQQNWNNGSAPAQFNAADNVTFNDTNNNHYAVTLNSTVTPGSVTVNNSAGDYTISGTGAIAGSGGLTKTGTSALTISTVNTYTGNTTVNGGTLTLDAGGAIASSTITVTAPGVANINGAVPSTVTVNANGTTNFGGNSTNAPVTRQIGTLNIGAATASVAHSTFPGSPAILIPSAVNFNDPAAVLDLTDNELLAPGDASVAEGLIVAGKLVSSEADSTHALGYITAGGNMEVRYTLKGDANMDGTVNVGDLGALATSYNITGGMSWANGDFNHDDTVNVADLGALATNYNISMATGASAGGGAASSIASPMAVASGAAAVPEPASATLLALGAAATLIRRRRRA
ncbi:MAG TPA: autotransporter-associated beta strand repeat-containing protein [Tepidisphaeraceae bacterium]|nr:autotransporter-associated beta strand repeat-containing protein [Tepidisphaeraceae bacterium]